MSLLAGRTALVTGASGGIGRAVAASLAAEGCRLVLSGRALERLRATADACRPAPELRLCAGDLTDAATRAALEEIVTARFPEGLDILVHCAAELRHGTVDETSVDQFRRVLEVNAVGSFALLHGFARMLRAGSSVVLLNSSHGVTAPAGVGPYAASKHALRALTDSFRAEVNPRGIRVATIYCGKTATPMQRQIYADRGETARYEAIRDEILQPEDVAQVILATIALPPRAEITDIHVRPARKT